MNLLRENTQQPWPGILSKCKEKKTCATNEHLALLPSINLLILMLLRPTKKLCATNQNLGVNKMPDSTKDHHV
jgi:hypothetical protein